MPTLVTNGISINVKMTYQNKHSDPSSMRYIHSYQITIENKSRTEVKLLKRHWFIQSGHGEIREVKGDGVIGKQPVLKPGEKHQYVSWAPLNTALGKMYGYYTFINTENLTEFEVKIPEFKLVAPFKNN